MFGKVRWMVVSLMFLNGMINYLDRSALGVAAPLVTQDLHLDAAQLGIVFSVFSLGYAAFCFIGGYCGDLFGPKRVLSVSMGVWSLFCGLTAAVTGFWSMLVVRLFFGMGEGPISSNYNRMIRSWFPVDQRASAIGIANAGTPLGAAIAGPIVGLLALNYGWQISFVAVAVIGFIWIAVWHFSVTDQPQNHPDVGADELAELSDPEPAVDLAQGRPPLSSILLQPTVLATAFAFFGYITILFFFINWFPSYLVSARHMSIHDMSLATAIPWTIGVIGLAAGGFVSDFMFRLTGNAVKARKLLLVVCLLIAGVGIAVSGLVESVRAALALTAISVFFLYLTCSSYWVLILDTVEPSRVGVAGGFIHFVANCGGIIAPLVTGFIVQETGSYAAAFVWTGAIAVCGALAVAFFVRPPAIQEGAAGPIGSVKHSLSPAK